MRGYNGCERGCFIIMTFFDLQRGEKKEIEKAIQAVAEQHITVSKDKAIKLKYPANVIEWATGEDFHGLERIYSNRGQYYALREFFQCYCPVCSDIHGEDVFSVSEEELKNDVLLVRNWEEGYDYCPICGTHKEDFEEEGALKSHNIMLGIVGMRAGKTMLAAIMMTFIEMFMVSTGNIKKALGLESAPFIEMACIAVSAQQAKDTIWAQYMEIRNSSPWFTKLYEQMLELGHVKSKEYDLTSGSVITNDICGYKVVSLASSSASIAGRTRIWFVIDELGRFDTTDSKRSASEVWRVGNSSLKTIRKSIKERGLPSWLSSLIAIESPISVDDYGMKMYSGMNNVRHLFKMKFSTWGFNKEYEEADFSDEFETDYHGAVRDFGAQPPGAELPFIEDWDLFLKYAEDKMLTQLIRFEDTVRTDGDITYVGKRVTQVPMDQDEWFIAGDAGKTKDTFALVGGKKIRVGDGFIFTMGFAMHILPNKSQKRYVDFTCILDILDIICKRVRVSKILFDHWNSESIMQEGRKKGLPIEQFAMSSVRVDDFFKFRNDLPLGLIKCLPRTSNEDSDPKLMDSQSRFYWEMKRMQRSKDLKRVDHSKNSTSDIVECVVNCYRMATILSERKGQMFEQNADAWGSPANNIVRMSRW